MPKPTTTLTDLLDPAQRHIEPRAGQVGHNRMSPRLDSINVEARTIEFTCSTGDVDRYGEIVEPRAFKKSLPAFLRTPAFPAGHDYEFKGDETPTVGHWKSMEVRDNALVGTAWFKPRGLGEECFLDYQEGNLTSVSVAWLTRKHEMRDMTIEGAKQRVRVFTEVDLIECSAVLIPANEHARLRAAHFGARQRDVSVAWSDDPQELAEFLAAWQDRFSELDNRLELIEQSLSNEPGSKQHQLILDTVELMQRSRGHVAPDGVTPPGGEKRSHPILEHFGQ